MFFQINTSSKHWSVIIPKHIQKQKPKQFKPTHVALQEQSQFFSKITLSDIQDFGKKVTDLIPPQSAPNFGVSDNEVNISILFYSIQFYLILFYSIQDSRFYSIYSISIIFCSHYHQLLQGTLRGERLLKSDWQSAGLTAQKTIANSELAIWPQYFSVGISNGPISLLLRCSVTWCP